MEDWKQLLYDNYISTGQQGKNINAQEGLHVNNFPHFTRLIREHLPEQKDSAIADLACGHGTLVFCLKELGYENVVGVDNSIEQVALAQKLGLAEVRRQDIFGFLRDQKNEFDILFLMDVIEHFERPEIFELLRLARNTLRGNGKIIIHVPNGAGIFGMRSRYWDLTHEICFTTRSIEQVLLTCGFRDVHCFEEKPTVHGIKSFVRYVVWEVMTLPSRLLLIAETGRGKHVLSQNMLVTANVP